jgi:uncharacterized protein
LRNNDHFGLNDMIDHMLKFLSIVIVIGLVLYAAACAYLYFNQERFIFPGAPAIRATPDNTGVIKRPNGDGEFTYSIHTARAQAPQDEVVLFFGGNGEDPSQWLDRISHWCGGRAVISLHYRGFGKTAGPPSEVGIIQDARLLLEQIAPRYRKIILVGRSLGTGVAMQLAALPLAKEKAQRMVLITPYDSIRTVAQGAMPIFPIPLLLKHPFDSAAIAPSVTIPTTIIAASRDQVIPVKHAQALRDAFKPSVVTYVELAGHHNGFDDEQAVERAFGMSRQ